MYIGSMNLASIQLLNFIRWHEMQEAYNMSINACMHTCMWCCIYGFSKAVLYLINPEANIAVTLSYCLYIFIGVYGLAINIGYGHIYTLVTKGLQFLQIQRASFHDIFSLGVLLFLPFACLTSYHYGFYSLIHLKICLKRGQDRGILSDCNR